MGKVSGSSAKENKRGRENEKHVHGEYGMGYDRDERGRRSPLWMGAGPGRVSVGEGVWERYGG